MYSPAPTIEEPKEHCRGRGGVVGIDREVVIGDTSTILADLAPCQAVCVRLLSSVDGFPAQVDIGVMI